MEYTTPTVIYLDVSEGWALDKLKSRGRADDTNKEEMDRKMEWFAEDVMPVLAHYKDDPRYKYIHVNGEQTIEQVHKELVEKLNHTK
jgi:adenylate kinase family enzyme